LTLPRRAEASDAADDPFDRRLTYAASVAALLLFVPLLTPLLSGRVFALNDLSWVHLPMRYLYQGALRAGHTVLWTSQLFGGFYIHAEGQVGALHPLHLLLYRTLPLTIAFNLEVILSYVFAFGGMWWFLRHSGLTAASSVVGGMAFAFSGFALLHLSHINMVAVVAHVPWLLLAIDFSLSAQPATRRRGLIAVSLLVGSQALLGFPQSVLMSAWICLFYAVICGRGLVLRLFLVAGASIVGLMLGGIQLVPTIELLTASTRWAFPQEFALSYSMHPLNILQLVSPYLLLHRAYVAPAQRVIHEFGIYSGALGTVALLWAALRRHQLPFTRLAVFAVSISIAGVLLALGSYGFVYEWIAMVPLVGKFRAPARHIVLVHFGFAVLVAILFEDVRRLGATAVSASRQHKWLWVPLAISAFAGAIAWWRPQLWGAFPDQPISGGGILIGGVLVAAATILVAGAARGSRLALIVLPSVLALDLGLWGYSYVFTEGMRTIGELATLADPPPADPGSTVHRPDPMDIPKLNVLLLHDLRVIRPYVGLAAARLLTLEREDELRVTGTQWVTSATGWRRVADPMPRVRFVPDWRTIRRADALSRIDIRRTALVTEHFHATRGIDAKATLTVDEPGRMLVDVSASGPALLVTTEAYDRGWRATGRNGDLQTLRVYGDNLGVVAEPGEYQLSLVFEPESFRMGLYTSLAGLIGVALLATVPGYTSRRSRRSSSGPARGTHMPSSV